MDAGLTPPRVRAVIIAVGSEMLTPFRTETNSLTIAGVLNGLGIDVASKLVVGDDRVELDAQIGHALGRHQVLILTGGLGPTDDDLTREVVASHLGLPLDEDPAIVESIRARFARRGWAMPEVNRKQALVPRGATVLANAKGSAPGLLIEHGDRIIALLPGPPREVRPMIEGPLRDRLAQLAGGLHLERRVLRIAGRTESRAEELTQPVYSTWLDQHPRIDTTILATPGFVELHLTTIGADPASGLAAIQRGVDQLKTVLGHDLVSTNGESIEQVVGTMLRERGWRIALAESCTGGLATSRLTDVPGSSDYVERSVVAYSNRAKTEWVGVPEATIRDHGAVSEPVARALAENVAARAGTEVGVGITGIAGPGGGSEEKPVGTVWIAVAIPGRTDAVRCLFPGGRALVKVWSALMAIDFVRRSLLGAPWDVDWAPKPGSR